MKMVMHGYGIWMNELSWEFRVWRSEFEMWNCVDINWCIAISHNETYFFLFSICLLFLLSQFPGPVRWFSVIMFHMIEIEYEINECSHHSLIFHSFYFMFFFRCRKFCYNKLCAFVSMGIGNFVPDIHSLL